MSVSLSSSPADVLTCNPKGGRTQTPKTHPIELLVGRTRGGALEEQYLDPGEQARVGEFKVTPRRASSYCVKASAYHLSLEVTLDSTTKGICATVKPSLQCAS
jgi:hypothetical protein